MAKTEKRKQKKNEGKKKPAGAFALAGLLSLK